MAQAIPMYAMSLFKIPVGLCKDIEKLVANFWWGSSKDKNNLHWKAWETLNTSKQDREMDFKEFIAFN